MRLELEALGGGRGRWGREGAGVWAGRTMGRPLADVNECALRGREIVDEERHRDADSWEGRRVARVYSERRRGYVQKDERARERRFMDIASEDGESKRFKAPGWGDAKDT